MIKVKICGITRIQDALLSAELGAWAVGFVFYQKSKRFIDPLETRKIIEQLPDTIKKVGVFVNPTAQYVKETVEKSGLTTVQLHGEESSEFCADLKYEIIKCLHIENEDDLDTPLLYTKIPYFLFDGFDDELRGGDRQAC